MIYPVISDMHVPEKFNVSLHLAYLKGFAPFTDWRTRTTFGTEQTVVFSVPHVPSSSVDLSPLSVLFLVI